MAKVKDLPPEIRQALVRQLDFNLGDDVSYFSASGLEFKSQSGKMIVDREDDGNFHFYIKGKDKGGFVLIDGEDQIHFVHENIYKMGEKVKPISVIARGVSYWAEKIDPKDGSPAKWDEKFLQAAEKDEVPAKKLLEKFSKKDPECNKQSEKCQEDRKHIYSAAYFLINSLSVDHPARSFLLSELKNLWTNLDRNWDIPRIRHLIRGFKSTGIYYAAADRIWGQEIYNHIRQKETVRILVPGAGTNTIAVMSLAMRLIDRGANNIEILSTEFKEGHKIAFGVIGDWINHNSKFYEGRVSPLNIISSSKATRTEKGERYEMLTRYKGRQIRIVYAYDDSPTKDMYFHPRDLVNSLRPDGKVVPGQIDIVVAHDISSYFRTPDIKILPQLLPNLPKDGKPVAFLTPNGLDVNPDAYAPYNPSVYPFIDNVSVIHGPYGCAASYSSKFLVEMGITRNNSALLIPVRYMNGDDVKRLVSLAIMAGGPSYIFKSGFSGKGKSTKKAITINNPFDLIEWAAGKYKQLKDGDEKDYFMLVTARFIAKLLNDPLVKQDMVESARSLKIPEKEHLDGYVNQVMISVNIEMPFLLDSLRKFGLLKEGSNGIERERFGTLTAGAVKELRGILIDPIKYQRFLEDLDYALFQIQIPGLSDKIADFYMSFMSP